MIPAHGGRPTVVYAVTIARSAIVLLRGQLATMRDRGYRVVLVCSPDEDLSRFAAEQGVEVVPLTMSRSIASAADVRSLLASVRLLRRLRPDIVNAATPKAALVVGLAAWIARVPVRIYSLWGLRLEGEQEGSLRHRLLWAAERLTCAVSTIVLCASPTLRDRAVGLRLVTRARSRVLGRGSTNGVDLRRFGKAEPADAAAAREAADIPAAAVVVGFVGRIVADKGVEQLLHAYRDVAGDRDCRLVFVGEFDDADPLPEWLREQIRSDPRITVTGVVDPAPWYRAMDVFVLPSRREGLPNVMLEAAATGLPTITTDATGCPDSVDDGRSGIVVPVGNAQALAVALRRLLDDAGERDAMGKAGRAFVEEHFEESVVWGRVAELYDELLARTR